MSTDYLTPLWQSTNKHSKVTDAMEAPVVCAQTNGYICVQPGPNTCSRSISEVRYFATSTSSVHYKKVQCTLVQALRLCTGRTAQRGSRGIALPFLDHGTRRGWGVSVTPRPLFTPGKDTDPFYRRLGGPQARSGQVCKSRPPTGIRSPDLPARSQSLYRLSYSAHHLYITAN